MNDSPLLYATRHARLAEALNQNQLDALALNPGPTLTYLTGLRFHLMERPVTALFSLGRPPTLVLPELETAKLDGLPFTIQAFPYGEDPARWPAVFEQAAACKQTNAGIFRWRPTFTGGDSFRRSKERQ